MFDPNEIEAIDHKFRALIEQVRASVTPRASFAILLETYRAWRAKVGLPSIQ